MSNNLLTMARDAMGEAMAQKLAPVLDCSADMVSQATTALVPALLAGIGGRGDSLNGAGALLSFTDQPRIDSDLFARLPALLDEPREQLLGMAELGKNLLLALFGEKTMALTHELSGLSAMPTESAGRLMGIVATLLFSMVKSEAKRLDLGAADLQSLLAGQQGDLMAQVDPRLSAALELHAVHARPAQGPAASRAGVREQSAPARPQPVRPMPAKLTAASGYSWPQWLTWVLGTMAILWGVSVWIGRASTDREGRPPVSQTAQAQGTGYPAPVRIYFEAGKYETPDDTSRLLANIIEFSRVNTSSLLQVTAYVDGSGDPAVNAKLSKARAMAIRSVLITGGITEDRVNVDKSLPASDVSDGSAGRRVDIAISR